MSSSSKITIAVIVVLILGAGVWWYTSMSATKSAPAQARQTTATLSDGTLTTSASDTSDTSLSADISSIDGGMNSLSAAASATTSAK